MHEDIQLYLDQAEEDMSKVIHHLQIEMAKIRAGKANTAVLDGVKVDYYGNPMPLNQIAGLSTSDARTMVIQPWEKSMLQPIEKAIISANLGLTPSNDGTVIRIHVPPLTEERRRELVKRTRNEGETAKVAVRNIRREANEVIKKLQKDGVPEDMVKEGEMRVQKLTDKQIVCIDELLMVKEKDIMTV
ncbi:MAG: ribosome recycling factor [Sphingomonadales bacterium]|nr:ribosome recycling factor [Sphingomonadales bacterium]